MLMVDEGDDDGDGLDGDHGDDSDNADDFDVDSASFDEVMVTIGFR